MKASLTIKREGGFTHLDQESSIALMIMIIVFALVPLIHDQAIKYGFIQKPSGFIEYEMKSSYKQFGQQIQQQSNSYEDVKPQ